MDLTVLILYSDSCFQLDGLVKRLEELERTAELYKGKLRLSSDTRGGRGIPPLCCSEMIRILFSGFYHRLDRAHQKSSQGFL